MSMRKTSSVAKTLDRDLDAVDVDEIDLDKIRSVDFQLDPAVVEQIRARRRLKMVTLRLGNEQIQAARAVSGATGEKYQAILRRWIAEGASRELVAPESSSSPNKARTRKR